MEFMRCRAQFLHRIRIEERLPADLHDVDEEVDVLLVAEDERDSHAMLERHAADTFIVDLLGGLRGVRVPAVAHIPAAAVEEKPLDGDVGLCFEERTDLFELEDHGVIR